MSERVALAAAQLGDRARSDVSLAPSTTYRVGGAAALWVRIDDEPGLEAVATAVARSGVDVLVVSPGFVATDIRQRALGRSGAALGKEGCGGCHETFRKKQD